MADELVRQIQALSQQVKDITAGEIDLVRSLGDTLHYADAQVLHQVRTIVADHTRRRADIMAELVGLAERIGCVPRAHPVQAAATPTLPALGPEEPDPLPRMFSKPPPIEQRFSRRDAVGGVERVAAE